jgi:hypothetical protein
MKKVLVKYYFPWWRVVVYNDYSPGASTYIRPETFFSKTKAKDLAKKIRFDNL